MQSGGKPRRNRGQLPALAAKSQAPPLHPWRSPERPASAIRSNPDGKEKASVVHTDEVPETLQAALIRRPWRRRRRRSTGAKPRKSMEQRSTPLTPSSTPTSCATKPPKSSPIQKPQSPANMATPYAKQGLARKAAAAMEGITRITRLAAGINFRVRQAGRLSARAGSHHRQGPGRNDPAHGVPYGFVAGYYHVPGHVQDQPDQKHHQLLRTKRHGEPDGRTSTTICSRSKRSWKARGIKATDIHLSRAIRSALPVTTTT